MDTPTSVDELVTSLVGLPGQPATPVVLDALDEAASPLDRRQITEALAELAGLRGLRVAVATRPLAAGNPYAPGGLLPMLGITGRGDSSLVDLDSDIYFDLDGLRQFAAALLAQEGMDSPGPPGAAWTKYHTQSALCSRLAMVIADRAGRNFLVAAMAAVPLSIAPHMIDPDARGFNPADIPSGVGEALSKYLDQLPEYRRERHRGLLTALAYARGTGLDDLTWLAFADALGYSSAVPDLDTLRHSSAADYLLQTTTIERGSRPVTRLFHQALTDELLAARHQPSDEGALLDMLLGLAGPDWFDAPSYILGHLAAHAAAADRLDELLEDPVYLAAADADQLLRVLPAATSSSAKLLLQRVGSRLPGRPAAERAAVLELGARQLGDRRIADRLAELPPGGRPWSVRWAHQHPVGQDRILGWHDGPVRAVAVGQRDGREVVVSGGADGMIRIWDLRAGGTEDPWHHGAGGVEAVAVGQLADGPVVVSGGANGKLRCWRMADGSRYGKPLGIGGKGKVTSVAIGDCDGRPFIVAAYESVRTVALWDLGTGRLLGELEWGSPFPLSKHIDAHVNAVAAGSCDGRPVIVAGHTEGAHKWVRTGSQWVAEWLISGAVQSGRSRWGCSASARSRSAAAVISGAC